MNKKRRSLLVLIVIVLIACSSMLVKTSLKNSEKNSSVTELADVEVKDNLHSSVTEDDNMYIDEDVRIEEEVLTEEDVQSDKKTVYMKEKAPVIPSASNSSTQENDENQDKTVVNKSEDSSNSTSSGGESSKNENAQKPEKPQEQEKPQESAKPQEPQKPQKPQVDGTSVSADIKGAVDENNKLTKSVQMKSEQGVQAVVPAGVKVADGTTTLKLTITEKERSDSDVTVEQTENLDAYDIHIEGIAADNKTPITIELGEVLSAGLNKGNLSLYHVENGKTVEMTEVASTEDFTAHNQFAYNPENGALAVAMMSFSEVAVVSEEPKWEGNFDYSWYTNAVATADGETVTEYTIANADQLAGFGAIVGGMDGQTKDSFKGKTVKLITDINLGDSEENNNPDVIFYPIGYYNSTESYTRNSESVTSNVSSFEGTFDGNGHTISNFYQNTWEMFGDYNDGYSAGSNYYKDAMGLFGYVANGTVKNLTVNNFSSDGEFTPTGVIAAYAANATFENIAITNCNPRVYNTGNGGIVGIGGNSNDPDTYKLTFSNITIDNTNKITALWGSWDVACGGLVGMFRGAGHVYMTNCHVASQIDVYNDVCGNYQYYWYRYSGMMVGTNKNMITDDAGYTVPETSKFHAENCTVHFGDWNDYYYCELVANSLASYTHDHQFSRLEQITSLDEIKSGDTWKKAGNFLLIDGDTKTCYHIVNKNGVLTQHNHADAGEETVNGETVLKENNQIVYLPFNQLFTGYGWGVKHIPVYNGEDYAFEGITILDREEANSEKKFEKADAVEDSYKSGTTVKIGELFKAATIDDSKLTIKPKNVQVTVSPADEDSTAGGTYVSYTEVADAEDWTDGELTFNGKGNATVTITDYYFCTPTTIKVNVDEIEKFAVKFPNVDKYIYRVGNASGSPVALGSLFKEIDNTTLKDSSVKVTIDKVYENSIVGGVFTENTSEWEKGTIQFSGTGVVKVTITEEACCIPKELFLEVVDATNVTKFGELRNCNVVLLNDITINDNSAFYLSGGAILYGNGFTFDCTNAAYKGSGSVSENYIIGLVDAHLDNIKIVGKVYTEYGAQAANDYNRALVVCKGNSSITNCYLSNTASPIRLVEGSLKVKGTTVKGGNFANIDVRNGHLTIEDVTTINQANANDEADDGANVVGLGIVVYYENVDKAQTSITIKGTLKQYNHISSNDTFSHEYATELVNKMMGEDYSDLQIEANGVTWVNTGIVSMTEDITVEGSETVGYLDKDAKFLNKTGHVYTVKPTETSVSEEPKTVIMSQGLIAPKYIFDYTNKNYIAKTDGSNDYCYYDNGKVLISMDQGDTFEWDPYILTVTKNENEIDYSVEMNGKTYNKGDKIPFDTSEEYIVTYTYEDDNNYTLNEDDGISTISEKYTQNVIISVAVVQPSAKHATFTFGSSNTVTEKITVNDKTYVSAKNVTATDKQWGYISVNGTEIFYPIINAEMKKNTLGTEVQVYYYVFNGTVKITDYKDAGTGDEQIYNASTTTMPSNLTVVNGMEAKYTDVNSACVDISKLTKDGPSGEVWDFSASTTVSGTTTYNGYLAHRSPSGLAIKSGTRDYDAITVAQFSYTDAAGETSYYFVGYFMPNQVSSGGNSGGCVVPDTLITLADGTQKKVQELNPGEELLVWNLETGTYDVAPIVFVDSEQDAEYEVTNLSFSNGSEVGVIYEHGFFDLDLGEYVYITADNYSEYVGHSFVVEGDIEQNTWDVATLDNVIVETKTTTAWSPVTFKHLCYYTDGVLSMPGGISGLFNIFDVDTDTMMYDQEKKAKDIEEYGLLSFEAFEGKIPQIAYEAFNGNYLGVAMGKGLLTWDTINGYAERYIPLVPSIVAEELLEEVENSSKEPEAPSEEPEVPGEEPEAPSEEPEAPSEEPEAPGEEPEAPGEEPEAPSEEPEAPSEEPEAPSEEPEA